MGLKKRTKNIIENFLSGEKGKRFFQIFYSLGAAVVIIGALAKLNHWPFGLGNVLLTVGLVTEFFVFLISAFDHPTKEYAWELVFPILGNALEDRPLFGPPSGVGVSGSVIIGGAGSSGSSEEGTAAGSGGFSGGGGGAIIIGGGGYAGGGNIPQDGAPESASAAAERMSPGQVRQSFGIPNAVAISEEDTNALTESIKKMASAADQLSKMAEMTDATQEYLDQLSAVSENMEKFRSVTGSLTDVSDILLNSYRSITDNSDEINQSSVGYVHQMEALNRNIAHLNNSYELQLYSVSSQMDAVNRINAGLSHIKEMYEGSAANSTAFRSETEKMTRQIAALNTVYSRLLNAMTVNMNMQGGMAYPNNPVNPAENV